MCNDGQSGESRATCLRESGAALAQARRGQLSDPNADYARNARLRCDALVGDDRVACIERMNGGGTVSGSVGAGGDLREIVTTVPAPTSPPAAK